MLTISAPIEIKAKTTYLRDPENFYRRIVGGYSLMETHIEEEDLLHIAATPPEIYVAEGQGMTSILNRSERNETNINKVEILNNVINRIIASAEVNLTYQDRVFITDALYKLGIKDDRRFMEAFHQMMQETKNTNTLINLYLENGENLREMVESVQSTFKREIKKDTKETEREKENYLYSTVMNRLKTGAVYQIVSNFNRSLEEKSIDAREYSLSSQSYTAQQMLLSILRKDAGITEENLIFYSGNTYEESVENEDVQIKDVKNEITSAVLFDMLQNIYHTGYDRFFESNASYYRFEDMFYKAADQTFLRLMNNAQTNYLKEIQNQAFITENSRILKAEIELREKGEEGRLTPEDIQRITETVNTMNIREETRRQQSLKETALNKQYETYLEETNKLTSSEIEHINNISEGQVTRSELEKITEAVNEINVQNEKRRQRYVQEIQRLKERQTPEEPMESGIRQTRKDAQLALTSPEKLLKQLDERREKRAQRQNTIINELKHIFPDQSMEVYQILNNYREGDVNLIQNNLARPADIGELMQDINTINEYHEETIQHQEKRDIETTEFLEAVKAARQEEEAGAGKAERGPVMTIHRRSETITAEELGEQLDIMEKNFSKHINKTVETSSVTNQTTTHTTEVKTNESQVNHLTARDVQVMIDNNMKSQMQAISNQVLGKLERQMKNEKMRRGY